MNGGRSSSRAGHEKIDVGVCIIGVLEHKPRQAGDHVLCTLVRLIFSPHEPAAQMLLCPIGRLKQVVAPLGVLKRRQSYPEPFSTKDSWLDQRVRKLRSCATFFEPVACSFCPSGTCMVSLHRSVCESSTRSSCAPLQPTTSLWPRARI